MFSFFLKNATWCSLTHSLLVTFHGAMLLYVAYEARINFTYWWLVSQKKKWRVSPVLTQIHEMRPSCYVLYSCWRRLCGKVWCTSAWCQAHTSWLFYLRYTAILFRSWWWEQRNNSFSFLRRGLCFMQLVAFFAEWTNPTCGKCWKLSI